jgi:hypothetical protein
MGNLKTNGATESDEAREQNQFISYVFADRFPDRRSIK